MLHFGGTFTRETVKALLEYLGVYEAFGGLALFGVIGVFVKQLFWPSDSGKSSDKGDRP